MKNSDRMRIGWLLREGHHPMLTTVNGPYYCYRKWEVRAYTVALAVFAAVLIWVVR